MPIRARLDALKCTRVVYEARYDEGYRYLDHCGETFVRIRKHNASWIPGAVDPQRGIMVNRMLGLSLNVSSELMSIHTNKELNTSEMDKHIEVLGKEAEILYKIIVDTLSVPNTTRVGLRCMFFAPADSLEEAYRFICKVPHSPLCEKLVTSTKYELCNAALNYVLEEPESGLRKRIQAFVGAQVQPENPPMTGLSSDDAAGGIMADIDTFTRPENGHFSDAGMFIQKHYFEAKGLANCVFAWMIDHQK